MISVQVVVPRVSCAAITQVSYVYSGEATVYPEKTVFRRLDLDAAEVQFFRQTEFSFSDTFFVLCEALYDFTSFTWTVCCRLAICHKHVLRTGEDSQMRVCQFLV